MAVTIDQVHRLASQLSPADQLRLVEELAHELREQQSAPDEFPVKASAQAAADILGAEDFRDWESK